MSEAPEPICDLAGVLRTLRNARAALSSQGDQIDQMKGMFGDEDGTIAAAVEDGDDSADEIELAIAFVSALIEAEAYDAATAQALDAEAEARDLEIAADLADTLDGARTAGLAKPTAIELHDMAVDIRDEWIADLAKAEHPEDAEVVLSSERAQRVMELLVGAAMEADDAANPVVPEILVNCSGGIVQDILTIVGQPKVLVYVEENDLDDRDPKNDNDMVLLQDEDPANPDFFAEVYTTHGDAFPADGRRWSTLRSELARLHARGVRSDLVHLVKDDADDTDAA